MIHEALFSIQKTLKAPKGQRNSFGNYNYRSCEDILEAVKPLLAKVNAVLTLSDEMVDVGGRVYVKATATISDGKETVSTTAFAREEETKKGMDSSQITGAASSYARKYALNGLFCIDDTKDSDATNTGEDPVCEKCGKKIVSYERGGKTYPPTKHCALSMQKIGKIWCIDCIEEAKG